METNQEWRSYIIDNLRVCQPCSEVSWRSSWSHVSSFFLGSAFTRQELCLPASKRSMKRTTDLKNILSDKSLLVECLTKAGMVVKVK